MSKNIINTPEREVDNIDVRGYEYGFSRDKLKTQAIDFRNWWKRRAISNDVKYFTRRAGMVYACTITASNQTIEWFTDWVDATTKVAQAIVAWWSNQQTQITFPVASNSYYRVKCDTNITFSYFTSF